MSGPRPQAMSGPAHHPQAHHHQHHHPSHPREGKRREGKGMVVWVRGYKNKAWVVVGRELVQGGRWVWGGVVVVMEMG